MLMLMFAVKMTITYFKTVSYFQVPEYKMKAVYALLRDMVILLVILAFALGLHYWSLLDFYHTNVERLLYGIYIFLVLWLISSLILFYTSYYRLRTFFGYESISKDVARLEELKRFYEHQHINNENINPVIRDQLQFQLMRQAFIYPIELPVIIECFLRRDFNFSMYIGYCITDLLSELVGFISLRLVLNMIAIMASYQLVNTMSNRAESITFYSIPIVVF